MSANAHATFFGPDGKPTGIGASLGLPDCLDWMPIDVKVFWFLDRGYGEPGAKYVLFTSQGEQRLLILDKPLSHDHQLMKERHHGYQERLDQFIDEGGFSRTPRNQ